MKIDEIFNNNLYPEIKEYLEATTYAPKVVKTYAEESKVFPIVTIILTKSSNTYQNLTYGEETESFTIDINIYSNDVNGVSKRKICNSITNEIVTWFKENLHVAMDVSKDIENIDTSIHRDNIRVTGVLDLKEKDNPIIVPTLNSNNYSWH